MSYINVAQTGTKKADWIRGLTFYKEDIAILQGRLYEIAKKNTGTDFMVLVEHFQNQFIIQLNNIDELLHAIHRNEEDIARDSALHAGHISNALLYEQNELGNQYALLEKIIKDLRHEFKLFLGKWM